ncbi:hypothetical protein [Sphingomonas molluscorum]|uniref:hypothetical protein n=1 Tax=Sphingomonas molluscorum TaxID=418184 RepID=UPI0031DF7B63
MRDIDIDIDSEWIADLDWSRHRIGERAYLGGKIILTSVVDMLVKHVCAPPPEGDSFLANAGNTPPGRIVDSEGAFNADGTPIHSVHRRLDSLMRSHADDLEIGITSPDMITRDEWDAIIFEGQGYWSDGVGARYAANAVAPILARMAYDKQISCFARRINGSPDPEDISGPEWWDLLPDQAVRRIATSGLNLARPMDADAPIDHLIFVSRDGLQNALIEAARKNYVELGASELGPWGFRRSVDYYAVQRAEVAEFLIQLMDSGEWEYATNSDFEAAVQAEFGTRGLGRCYERAKAIAVSDNKRSRFKKRRSRAASPEALTRQG